MKVYHIGEWTLIAHTHGIPRRVIKRFWARGHVKYKDIEPKINKYMGGSVCINHYTDCRHFGNGLTYRVSSEIK